MQNVNWEVTYRVSLRQALQIAQLVLDNLGLEAKLEAASPPYPGKLIFISYRRQDSLDISGRIYDHLLAEFKADSLFRDYESILPSADWLSEIEKNAAACDVMLVIIGPGWLNARDENGRRRLDKPDDVARIEVKTVLDRLGRGEPVHIIPVIVNGAAIPGENDLPVGLRSLSFKQAYTVRSDQHFRDDIKGLVKAIKACFDDETAPTA